MKVDIANARSGKTLITVNVTNSDTIADVKKLHIKQKPSLYPSRISYKVSPKEKTLGDSVTIGELETFTDGSVLYFKDLGPQVGWSTVFIAEYTGPIFAYLVFYWALYNSGKEIQCVQKGALICWCFHYIKRVLETIFVHRFSKGTMPIGNLFKNCSYYWGFAAAIAYFINHPDYTLPAYGETQINIGILIFAIGEIGNFSCHMAFKNMRPAGSTVRVIPMPNSNPFTLMFNLVSCPNYTYEVISWIGFTIMTQTFMGGLFTFVGAAQMLQWALGKHRNYKKEFKDYPKNRKAMIPFIA